MPAVKTDITRQRTASFSRIFTAFNVGRVVAEWQNRFLRDGALNFRWVDEAFQCHFMTAIKLALHPYVTATARLKTFLFTKVTVFTHDLFTRLRTFKSLHSFTAFYLGYMLTVGEDFFHFDVTIDALWRAETIDFFLQCTNRYLKENSIAN